MINWEHALRDLAEDLARSSSADALAARWGERQSSVRWRDGIRVQAGANSPFAALEIRPWSDDVTGVVDIEFRQGVPACEWTDARERLGPFRELASVHLPGQTHGTTWTFDCANADVFVIVTVANGLVDDIRLRRDSR